MKTNNIVSIVLLVVTVALNLILLVPAIMLVMSATGCHEGCPLPVVETGIWIAIAGPWIVWLLGGIFTVTKLVKKQDALYYSLITIGGSLGAFLLGVAITFVTMAA